MARRFPFFNVSILIVTIYTDGSYSPQHDVGAWAALLFVNDEIVQLSAIEHQTTHNRMELLAIIKSIDWLNENSVHPEEIIVITDSQYAERLPLRKEKLITNNFITKKGNELRNADLLKLLFAHLDTGILRFIKVRAHQPKTGETNYNRVVDELVRALLRGNLADK